MQKIEAAGLEHSTQLAAVQEAAQEKEEDLQQQLLTAHATCSRLQVRPWRVRSREMVQTLF